MVQDTFVRAMEYLQKSPDRVPLKVNFRAWLRAIARNLTYDRFRRIMVAPRRSGEEALDLVPVESSPEERAILAEDLATLRKCIDSLAGHASKVFRMKEVDELGPEQICAQLGMTSNCTLSSYNSIPSAASSMSA